MTKVSDAYTWDEMCNFTGDDMDNLLRFYASGAVPPLHILLAMRRDAVWMCLTGLLGSALAGDAARRSTECTTDSKRVLRPELFRTKLGLARCRCRHPQLVGSIYTVS